MSCDWWSRQRGEPGAAASRKASEVVAAAEPAEAECEVPSPPDSDPHVVLENVNVLNIGAPEPTHRVRTTEGGHTVQREGFRRTFPKRGLRFLRKQREGLSARTLPLGVLLAFIPSGLSILTAKISLILVLLITTLHE